MNKYYEYWQKTLGRHARDKYFQEVLGFFDNKPLKILEIGCARRLEMDESNNPAKKMDGWSSLFWADYISKNGGKLTIIDNNYQALENCRKLLSDFIDNNNICFFCKIVNKNIINENYDLIFLDSGDSPIECQEQFEMINRDKTSIFCDDGHVKGITIRAKYQDYLSFDVNGEGHLMLFYPSKELNNKLNLVSIIENPASIEQKQSCINMVSETNKIDLIQKNGEKIVQVVFYGKNRNDKVLEYNKRVFSKFGYSINYVYFPFEKGYQHGDGIDWFIKQTIDVVSYWIFWDYDSIPLWEGYLDWIYNKINDKITLLGSTEQSNHLKKSDGTCNFVYIGTAPHAISKDLYLNLGSPTYRATEMGDRAELVTRRVYECGFCIYQLWPSKLEGMTNEECDKYGIDRKHAKSDLGNGFKFGFGSTYGPDLFYHQMNCIIEPRHTDMFISKCQEVLNKKILSK